MSWPIAVYLLAVSAGTQQAAGLVVVAGITAGGTYLVARRSSSGSISTSDAGTLWQESRAIREELREEVMSLRASLLSANERAHLAEQRTKEAEEATRVLRERVAVLEARYGHTGD